ncbi:MAG: D-glycero-beta-D-manno-heptose-7-phosphate kinase [Burkholderiaceae bacterium]|nr:D-glycero-beta-D-manno-heptose-7-phosphate kinase [Burkholderiaceae bacterium]
MHEALHVLKSELFAKKIVCIGDVMMDRYVYGGTDRISPEAPIPVLKFNREHARAGGASNVAANLATLGAKVTLVSVVGNDPTASELHALLGSWPRIEREFFVDEARPTTEKIRFLGSAQQLLRLDKESTSPLCVEAEEFVLARALAAFDEADVVVLSDYAKGVLTPALTQALINAAKDRNIPVLVDPKGADYSKYAGATLITPNLDELSQALRTSLNGDEIIVDGARRLLELHCIGCAVITRSEEGMTLVVPDAPASHIASIAREVSDVTGAGDTVVAYLAAGLAVKADILVAARLANIAAGLSVARLGAVQIALEEVENELAYQRPVDTHSLIFQGVSPELLRLRKGWKARGLRVGLTNGCFDLLHLGHLHSLEQARAQCDILIVALNSDASVKRLKGKERPIQCFSQRAATLASLRTVDAVVLFDEDTPQHLIETLLPDVLFKGADYAGKLVAGAEAVIRAGGSLALLPLLKGYSTTSIISRLQAIGAQS